MSTDGDLKYWKANENEPETPEINYWYYRPRSADTETTAYALLSIVNIESSRSSKIAQGLPASRWLSTQRNILGGFGSTQVKKCSIKVGVQECLLYFEFVTILGEVYFFPLGHSDWSTGSSCVCQLNL